MRPTLSPPLLARQRLRSGGMGGETQRNRQPGRVTPRCRPPVHRPPHCTFALRHARCSSRQGGTGKDGQKRATICSGPSGSCAHRLRPSLKRCFICSRTAFFFCSAFLLMLFQLGTLLERSAGFGLFFLCSLLGLFARLFFARSHTHSRTPPHPSPQSFPKILIPVGR